MGTKVGPNIVEDGLIYLIDPQSTRSYPGSGTTVSLPYGCSKQQ